MQRSIDLTDWKILRELQKNGRLSITALAGRVGLSRAAVSDRMEALAAAGIIRGFSVDLDPGKLGLTVSAMVRIRASTARYEGLVSQIGEIPEVAELHVLSGSDLMLAKVYACSTAHLERVIKRIATKADTETALVFSTRKSGLCCDSILRSAMDEQDQVR